MTDEPDNLTLRHLRALDAKLDQLAKDMARGFETISGHLVAASGPRPVTAPAPHVVAHYVPSVPDE